MLKLKRYGWLCVLGGEVFYFICLFWGYLPMSSKASEIHRALFEMLPGFTWGSLTSIFLGAVYVFIFVWIFAWYMVWMHNTSTIK